ncbi:MAG: response regulator [Puniceicoccales bacterium]
MAQRILVLDDEENYAEMLKTLLEQHFFLVDSVTEPARALECLHGKGYELVVSDFKMPGMDGAEFLIQARELNPDLPIILVSGLMNTPDLVRVANMGVTLVLEKPINIQNFIDQVKRFVEPATKEEFRLHRQGKSADAAEAKPAFKQTYPRKLRYLVDESYVFRYFLESVWTAVSEQDHIFISAPPGSEVDLLLREVSLWRQQNARQLYWLDMRNPNPARITEDLKALATNNQASHLVGVVGFDGAPLSSQQAVVDCIRESPEKLGFVYFIESHLLEADHRPIQPELLELIEQSLCQMPNMGQRLADLAGYAQRYVKAMANSLEKPDRASLTADAAPALLGYDWPGNFRELLDVLRCAVSLTGDGPVTGADVGEALQRLAGHEGTPTVFPSLADTLRNRQNAIITTTMKGAGQELPSTLNSLGVDPQSVGDLDSADQLPLIYPELVKS